MLRAGLIRQVAAGVYNWLPSVISALQVSQVVREEMDRAGAQEVLLPAVQPAELGSIPADGMTMGRNCLDSRTATSGISVLDPPMRKLLRPWPVQSAVTANCRSTCIRSRLNSEMRFDRALESCARGNSPRRMSSLTVTVTGCHKVTIHV